MSTLQYPVPGDPDSGAVLQRERARPWRRTTWPIRIVVGALLGWSARRVTGLGDARAAVAGFSDADVLVLLDHDPAFDAVLADGLRHGRGFVGALGSRHTQAERRERLLAAGLTDGDLAALHGPVGLDLGARTPAETAVSIVAQVIAARAGRSAAALARSENRIGP